MTVLHFERGFMYTLNRTFLVIIKCSLSYYTVLHYFEFIVVLKNQYKQTKKPSLCDIYSSDTKMLLLASSVYLL